MFPIDSRAKATCPPISYCVLALLFISYLRYTANTIQQNPTLITLKQASSGKGPKRPNLDPEENRKKKVGNKGEALTWENSRRKDSNLKSVHPWHPPGSLRTDRPWRVRRTTGTWLQALFWFAPATIHPTAKPIIILKFFRKSDPNISVRIMLMNERIPMPMNSGEPQGKGRGVNIVGHCWNIPLVGNFWHPFAPPPQFSAPEAPTRELPIKRTTVPVTYMYDKQLRAVGEKYVTLPVIIRGNNLFSVKPGTFLRRNKQEQYLF